MSIPVAAQTVTGTLRGTIVDSTGAVVPDAHLTAKNKETGLVRTVSSNGEGTYLISFLPLGRYDVTVEGKGFQRITKTDVLIELYLTRGSYSVFTTTFFYSLNGSSTLRSNQ